MVLPTHFSTFQNLRLGAITFRSRVFPCIFVNASCKYFTKIQTHRSEKSNASSCHRVRVYFCFPILQIFYIDTNASIRKKQRIGIVAILIFGELSPQWGDIRSKKYPSFRRLYDHQLAVALGRILKALVWSPATNMPAHEFTKHSNHKFMAPKRKFSMAERSVR